MQLRFEDVSIRRSFSLFLSGKIWERASQDDRGCLTKVFENSVGCYFILVGRNALAAFKIKDDAFVYFGYICHVYSDKLMCNRY